MDENRQLQKKLVELASAGRAIGGELLLVPARGRSLRGEFLRTLDGIVLARRLILTARGQKDLVCTAANRCLVEYREGSDPPIAIDSQDPETVEGFRAALDRATTGQESVGVRIERLARDAPKPSGGASAAFLANAWDEEIIAEDVPDGPELVSSFLEDNRASINAWCRKFGDHVESGGDADQFEAVHAFFDEMESQFVGNMKNPEDFESEEFLFVISATGEASDALFFCGHVGMRLAFSAPNAAVTSLAEGWRSAMG